MLYLPVCILYVHNILLETIMRMPYIQCVSFNIYYVMPKRTFTKNFHIVSFQTKKYLAIRILCVHFFNVQNLSSFGVGNIKNCSKIYVLKYLIFTYSYVNEKHPI